jgi:non-heme chloroperoxidase
MSQSFVTTRDGLQIFFKDWGSKDAQPIVFSHGWPLSADDWDPQLMFFLNKGFRVIAHDRRGMDAPLRRLTDTTWITMRMISLR